MFQDDDMEIFYDPAEFGVYCALRRKGQPDFVFTAITGVGDAIGLQGYVSSLKHHIQYPDKSVKLKNHDLVIVAPDRDLRDKPFIENGLVRGGEHYTVQGTPEPRNDGAERLAVLVKA